MTRALYRLRPIVLQLLFILALPGIVFAQTGRIAGTVTDADTREPLIGVNVIIDGTTQGTVTNADGFFSIINVSPGTHVLRVSYIGYTNQIIQEVRVRIDQTTTINVQLREEAIGIDEVVVTAQRPVIERDVSSSQVNVSARQVENLPVASVTGVVGLQAGIQGLTFRGGSSDQLAFMVNGLTFRDERDNSPVTSISLASVEEVQIQTGGFNAEYGNVRSGVVNVVTKEGRRDRYNADVIIRYAPAQPKNFGMSANDPNSYWIRPYVDPLVAMTGTSNWDWKTQRSYPSFDGWVAVAERRIAEGLTPMTPQALQQAFMWQHRKDMQITQPDFEFDFGFGGPVPVVSRALGNLRFYASLRREQEMYMIPLSTDRYTGQTAHVKLTSDIGQGMKLNVEGMLGEVTGTSVSRAGQPGIFRSAGSIAGQLSPLTGTGVGFIDTRIFASDYWTPTRRDNNMLGARFTHALDAATFYEVRAMRFETSYDTNPGSFRDTTCVVNIGGVCFDEAPFGFFPFQSTAVNGMRMGVGMANARDTSRVVVWNFKGDFTRQMNRYLQVKTGLEFNLTENLVNYGFFDQVLRTNNSWSRWDTYPTRGAGYLQSKLEFQGMVANLGFRAEYSHAGGEWYVHDPFDLAFSARFAPGIDTLLETRPTERLLTLSPRLGVSFPITANSKLFFNYGHFRSMPSPDDLFLLRLDTNTGAITRVADPNAPLPRTVAYEIGFEQAFLNQFLMRVAGYYRDVSLQARQVTYEGRPQAGGQTNYTRSEPNSYEDIRGFEFTVARNVGRWMQGFVNYTYMVRTFGYFGFNQVFENQTRMRDYASQDGPRRAAQTRPMARPYARMNLEMIVPQNWGPQVAGVSIFGDWRVGLLGNWQAGAYRTWAGGGGAPPGVANNVQDRDYYNWDMRFSRNFQVGGRRTQFFADISNLFNQRRMSFAGFVDGNDYNEYMRSLHLPLSDIYQNIPGGDRPGDFRRDGVEWQPMSRINNRVGLQNPNPDYIYYEHETQKYLEFQNGAWREVDAARLRNVLDNKAYIDNPNQSFLTFLNPRQFYFGIRLSL
jgi:hypothetical protein